MRLSVFLITLFQFFLPPALIGTAYLYFYPVLQLCAFPDAKPAEAACYFGDTPRPAVPSEQAPFRLLALGDPQLEGDTSLPGGPGIEWERGWQGVRDGVLRSIKRYHKLLDLWGNDLYLAHVYRTVRWWTVPTHTVVLGDLLGSQWISDEEFGRRARRFWDKVFRGTERVPGSVTGVSGRKEVLGADERWKKRIIAVAGNHDIGYAGDVQQGRVDRFEKAFGDVNWEITFRLNGTDTQDFSAGGVFGASALQNTSPELRLVVLNSMNLDGPAYDKELQETSRDFLQEHLHDRRNAENTGTILLTHIPLYKESGLCVDAPYFNHFASHEGGGIKEQNQLSEEMSKSILSGLVGPKSNHKSLVLNGHDHAGCDTYHYRHKDDNEPWTARRYPYSIPQRLDSKLAGLREITVQSMMGHYWGNVGLVSAWWDREAEEWKFDYAVCLLGVQHIWWAVHILDLVVMGFGVGGLVAAFREANERNRPIREKRKKA